MMVTWDKISTNLYINIWETLTWYVDIYDLDGEEVCEAAAEWGEGVSAVVLHGHRVLAAPLHGGPLPHVAWHQSDGSKNWLVSVLWPLSVIKHGAYL